MIQKQVSGGNVLVADVSKSATTFQIYEEPNPLKRHLTAAANSRDQFADVAWWMVGSSIHGNKKNTDDDVSIQQEEQDFVTMLSSQEPKA